MKCLAWNGDASCSGFRSPWCREHLVGCFFFSWCCRSECRFFEPTRLPVWELVFLFFMFICLLAHCGQFRNPSKIHRDPVMNRRGVSVGSLSNYRCFRSRCWRFDSDELQNFQTKNIYRPSHGCSQEYKQKQHGFGIFSGHYFWVPSSMGFSHVFHGGPTFQTKIIQDLEPFWGFILAARASICVTEPPGAKSRSFFGFNSWDSEKPTPGILGETYPPWVLWLRS